MNHPDRSHAFRLLFLALFVMGASNSMLFVILPMVTRAMGTGEIYVGLIFAGSSVFYMGFSPFWGSLSDHRGRRPILLIGLAGNTLSLAAIGMVAGLALSGALAPLIAMVFFAAGRLIYGAVGSAIQPAAQAYIADRTALSERTRLMSALTAGAGLGTAFGPPLAAWIGSFFGIESFVFAFAGFSFVVFVLIAIGLPEYRVPVPHTKRPRHLLRLARNPRLWPFLLVGVGGWTVQGVLLQTLLFYLLDKAHMTIEQAALVSGAIFASGAILVFGAQFVLIPVFNLRPRALMLAGVIISGLGAIAMALSMNAIAIAISFLLTSLGFGLARPGMISGVSLTVEPEEQGSAAGLATATAGAGFFLAPFTGLALYQFVSPMAAYGVLAVLMTLLTILVFSNRRIREIG